MAACFAYLCFFYLISHGTAAPHNKRAVPIPRLHQTVTNKVSMVPFITKDIKPLLCPLGHLPQKNGSQTFCCRPTICGPGFEIHTCQVNGSQDECVKCKDGFLQVNNISSFNMEEVSCFENPYLGRRRGCSIQDLKVARTQPSNCALFCECRTEDCYVGNPCGCEEVKPCGVNQYLNKNSQECEPCPEYSFKAHTGCGRCTYNLTAFSHGLTIPWTTTTITTNTTTVLPKIGNKMVENDIPERRNEEKDSAKIELLMGLMGAALFIFLSIGVVAVIKCLWKRRNCLSKRLCPPEADQRRQREGDQQGLVDHQRQENHLDNEIEAVEDEPLMQQLKEVDPGVDPAVGTSKEGQPDSGYSSNEAGHFISDNSNQTDMDAAFVDETMMYDTSFTSGDCYNELDNEEPRRSVEMSDTHKDRNDFEIQEVLAKSLNYSDKSSFKFISGISEVAPLSDAEAYNNEQISDIDENTSRKYMTLSEGIDTVEDVKQIVDDNIESSDTSVKQIVGDDIRSSEACFSPTSMPAVRGIPKSADKSIDVQTSLPYTDGGEEPKKERKVAKVGPMPRFETQPSQNDSIQSCSLASTITSYGEVHVSVGREGDFSDYSSAPDCHCDRKGPEGDSRTTNEDTDPKEIIRSENTVPKIVDGDSMSESLSNANEMNLEGAAYNAGTKEKALFEHVEDTAENIASSNEMPYNIKSEHQTLTADCDGSKTDDSFDATLPSNDSSVEIPLQSIGSNTDSVEIPLCEREMGDGAYSIEIEQPGQNNDLNVENDDD